MPEGQVLEFDRVTKRFGDVTAVADFSGRVEPGVVTGFLGPNGAGKTTTLRMLLGMLRPSSGSATIGGAHYAELKHAARVIGAMPEDPGFRPRRSVERHLITTAKANGIPLARVGEVIRFVGLDSEAESRIATLSLGMRQRLSAATALLGDPGALVLDEPANGLDPEGIRWMRLLIRGLADEGRTVLVSSHVLSEVEQVADEILVIARGQRKFAGSLATLADPTAGPVVVDALDRDALEAALTAAGFDFEVLRSGLTVRGSDAATIGSLAASAGVALTTLQQRGPTLEDVFLDLVNDRPVQFRRPDPVPDATVALPVVPEAEPSAEEPATEEATEEDAPIADAPIEATEEDASPAEEPAEGPAEAAAEASAPLRTSVIEIPSLVEDAAEDAADETFVVDEIPAAFAPVSVSGSTSVAADAEPPADVVVEAATEEAAAPVHDGEADRAPGESQGAAPAERSLPGLAGLAAAAAGITAPASADGSTTPHGTAADSEEGDLENPIVEEETSEPVAEAGRSDEPATGEGESLAVDAPAEQAVPSWSPVPDWMPAARQAGEGPSDESPSAEDSSEEPSAVEASDDQGSESAEPVTDEESAEAPSEDESGIESSEASDENPADEADAFFSTFQENGEQARPHGGQE
ncbi:ABC transporter ATP-binding protein [Microbacterium tumbae]